MELSVFGTHGRFLEPTRCSSSANADQTRRQQLSSEYHQDQFQRASRSKARRKETERPQERGGDRRCGEIRVRLQRSRPSRHLLAKEVSRLAFQDDHFASSAPETCCGHSTIVLNTRRMNQSG